jgi:hypothetical protein
MNTADILQALPNLPPSERLTIAQKALQLTDEEQQSLTQAERRQQLAIAAATAISDYEPGSELLVFSELDGEDFYEETDDNLSAHA